MIVDDKGGPCVCHSQHCYNEWLVHEGEVDIVGACVIEGRLFARTMPTPICCGSYSFVNCRHSAHATQEQHESYCALAAGFEWFRISSAVSSLCKREPLGGFSCTFADMRRRLRRLVPNQVRRAERGREKVWQRASLAELRSVVVLCQVILHIMAVNSLSLV